MCVVSLSLLEAVGVLSWVLRLAPAGSAEPPALCSPTPTWGCRPHVSEEGTARAPWGSTLSAAGAPWTHVNALARLLGGRVVTAGTRAVPTVHSPDLSRSWARGATLTLSSLLLPLLQVTCSVCCIASLSSMTVRLTTWAVAERKPS